MEFLGDMGHVESYFSPFGNYVSVGARKVHSLRQTYYRLRNDFWMRPMVLLCDEAQLLYRFSPFDDTANLDARQVHSLGRMYHRLRNHFGRSGWNY
jgi:hypothetical protein